ncbi:SIS domain-containing protein [Hoeflea sp. BAL378]|uniref:SIS domain-containing protein n=1 Tax=Hoeflea sp. BAL378 TaxID=1547437 RepID=UPI000689B154|nr:SIS domain-containing protein [Hoeflea sp. BAL378]
MTIMPGPTRMKSEILSVPQVVAGQMDASLDAYLAFGNRLASLDPNLVVTCARGSSDHAATYFKYLVEICLGVPVASIGPSVSSVYRTRWKLEGTPVIAISQSGGSDDLRLFMEAATRSGAISVSLTNDVASPLARATDTVLDMSAGPELAVAATKTYIASLVALAAIMAGWSRDPSMTEALRALPDDLDRALTCDWSAALERFRNPGSVFVTARGPGLGIANEAALKFKETCLIRAEAFSAAEMIHGPLALSGPSLTALAFLTDDGGREGIEGGVARLRETGSTVFTVDNEKTGAHVLPSVKTGHRLLDPIAQILSFYLFVEELAVSLGLNPDAPQHLNKVTVTR